MGAAEVTLDRHGVGGVLHHVTAIGAWLLTTDLTSVVSPSSRLFVFFVVNEFVLEKRTYRIKRIEHTHDIFLALE